MTTNIVGKLVETTNNLKQTSTTATLPDSNHTPYKRRDRQREKREHIQKALSSCLNFFLFGSSTDTDNFIQKKYLIEQNNGKHSISMPFVG